MANATATASTDPAVVTPCGPRRSIHRPTGIPTTPPTSRAAENAAMESFFALLQKNVLDRRRWDTRDELRLAIVTWIETKYHRRRRQRSLGRLTPVEFETIYKAAQAA
ncbi:hypothetical protein Acsp05_03340 [Actinokineospora sp. NBRC 105648]|nr:hypothetical protein Acsp05_03340 [Actinokineospora sp. NBRC 105648]